MDPMSVAATQALLKAFSEGETKRILRLPDYVLQGLLHLVLQLGVELSDELDRRVRIGISHPPPEGPAAPLP